MTNRFSFKYVKKNFFKLKTTGHEATAGEQENI